MKTTAKEFNSKPESAYRAADKGETVTINHDRYKDVVFELTARERGEAMALDSAKIEKDDQPIIKKAT